MTYPEKTILAIFKNNTSDIGHNNTFSADGASFTCQVARSRRASLPRDAIDYRVLVECPPDDGFAGCEAEVLVALRDGAIWNPGAHLRVARLWAEDTEDQRVIAERLEEWARSR